MIRLYIRPAACSLSPHIVARELDLDVRIVEVDRDSHRAADGTDFLSVNPNGYVPALVLENGEVLLEGPAIVRHLAEMNPAGGLVPRDAGESRRTTSLLNFVATELHKPMAQMFHPGFAPVKPLLGELVGARLDWISGQFAGDFLIGDRPALADFYLFVCLNWCQWLEIDLAHRQRLERFMREVGARPAVLAALAAEGLVHQPDGVFFAPRVAS